MLCCALFLTVCVFYPTQRTATALQTYCINPIDCMPAFALLRAGVMTCGPAPMVQEMEAICAETWNRLHMHKEVFLF